MTTPEIGGMPSPPNPYAGRAAVIAELNKTLGHLVAHFDMVGEDLASEAQKNIDRVTAEILRVSQETPADKFTRQADAGKLTFTGER